MKPTLLLITLTALSIGITTAEEEASKKSGQKGSGGLKLDTNGDKAISKEEAGEHWDRLSKLDKNSDGKVTGQEMMAARNSKGGSGTPGQGQGKGKGKGTAGKGDPAAMFKRADKNGDGSITKDEVPEAFWNHLSKADADKDGKVTAQELKDNAPARPGGPGGTPGTGKGGTGNAGSGEMFKRADKNQDGKISKDEVSAEVWARMSRLDKDSDGAVTKEEIAAGMASRGGSGNTQGKGKGSTQGGPGAMFERMDENNDGKLAEDEVPAEMWAKLRNADSDADGLVSKKELESSYQKRGQ